MKCFKLVLVFTFLIANLSFATEIMPLSEIKEGMTGVGRTVFKGNQIEEFQVEILGVLRNYMPQQSLILGMLKGGNLEETGVIAGMSGSPVYINGKMIGAVAYSWPFAKTPIAGITPIESMLKAQTIPADQQPPIAPPIEVANYYNFENLLTNHFKSAEAIHTTIPQFGQVQLMPIAAPLTGSGFNPKVLERFTPLFGALGMQPVQGGASTGSMPDALPTNLEPGSPISVQMIQGDFDLGAIGTVTYRDKDNVLAFGHPFYNLGPINFPMATAHIYAVVPSLFTSFKLGSAGSVVGSVKQDLHATILGVMGNKSPMIPVTVKMNDGKDERTFNFELANHKLLSPVLLDFAFQNSILVTQLGYSESTLKISGEIGVKGKAPVAIGNIFSGAGSFTTASQYVASIMYALMSNEFQNIDIQDVNIEVQTSMQRNESELLEVWLDRNEVRPGEVVRLKAMYRSLLGQKKFEEFSVKIPDDLQTSQIYFMVGGGQELSRQEFAIYGKAYQPDNIDQLIGLLNGLRANDRIYIKAFTNEPSLVMKGQFLYSLPSSAFSILSSSQTIGSSARVNRLALWEDSRPVDSYLTGYRIFSVQVLPKQN